MNHCLIEAEVLEAPQLRYTQDNQTPVAEMAVRIDGLRPEDPAGQIKVVGWGNLALMLQGDVQLGQRLMLEGRLRMSTVTRQDGLKEKRAELILSRLYPIAQGGLTAAAETMASVPGRPSELTPVGGRGVTRSPQTAGSARPVASNAAAPPASAAPVWNTAPLVSDDGLGEEDDDIPF